jgi:hypothetical protein
VQRGRWNERWERILTRPARSQSVNEARSDWEHREFDRVDCGAQLAGAT